MKGVEPGYYIFKTNWDENSEIYIEIIATASPSGRQGVIYLNWKEEGVKYIDKNTLLSAVKEGQLRKITEGEYKASEFGIF